MPIFNTIKNGTYIFSLSILSEKDANPQHCNKNIFSLNILSEKDPNPQLCHKYIFSKHFEWKGSQSATLQQIQFLLNILNKKDYNPQQCNKFSFWKTSEVKGILIRDTATNTYSTTNTYFTNILSKISSDCVMILLPGIF